MLKAITLDGFRCFDRPTPVTFGKLTVFAGANSVGKSSVIQSLLTFVQSEEQGSGGQLLLNGEWTNVGTFAQTVNYSRSGAERRFSLGITGAKGDREWDALFTFSDPDDPTIDAALLDRIEVFDREPFVLERKGSTFSFEGKPDWKLFTLSSPTAFLTMGTSQSAPERLLPYEPTQTFYLGAYRSRPENVYQARRGNLGPLLGVIGEYTAETILRAQRLPVAVSRPNGGAELPYGDALNDWWSYIFARPIAVRADFVRGFGYTLAVDTPSAERLGLGQVGFGLSQALPIVTLCLAAAFVNLPPAIVVVESPEIHLHPAAQHRLTDLFIALARAGRQVVLETHSDHIINAIRLAVKRGEKDGGLAPDDVHVHFFGMQEGAAAVERIPIDEHGRLERWPEGFFDQASQTLLNIIR
jgi:hypothetical protein